MMKKGERKTNLNEKEIKKLITQCLKTSYLEGGARKFESVHVEIPLLFTLLRAGRLK